MAWYQEKNESNIALMTKVSLSRNLENYPFTCKLTANEKKSLTPLLFEALNESTELELFDMETLSRYQTVSLAEKWLISPEFASGSIGRSLLLNDDESVSIMLFEEDHVKIQALCGGLNAKAAFETAGTFDKRLENSFKLAFNPTLGYLTQSPTNIGTALRAGITLHLYCLSNGGEIRKMAAMVDKLGMTLRPAYSERGEIIGDLFVLSNRMTLGISEENAINNLELIAQQIISREQEMRNQIGDEPATLDRIHRAFGILSNAYLLTGMELLTLLSPVRLGASIGVLNISSEQLNALFVENQSAMLLNVHGETITVTQREMLRAENVRNALFNG